MHDPKHNHSKDNFQLERFACFTDGLFAICITLLIFEIKVPESKHSDHELLKYLWDYSIKFLGFLISFFIIGHYWIVHHRIFGYVKRTTHPLLWINLIFILTVIFVPFSSGFVSEYVADLNLKIPYTIYVLNMISLGVANAWLWKYVSNPELDLLTHKISPERIKLGTYRSLIVPLVFLISLVFSIFSPLLARFIPVTIPIWLNWGLISIEKKADSKEKSDVD